MTTIVHLGNPNTKRIVYMQKAAKEVGVTLSFVPLPNVKETTSFDYAQLENTVVKIEPLDYKSAKIHKIESLASNYLLFLKSLTTIPTIQFLNSVESIANTMCKRTCKQILVKHKIPVTPMLQETITNIDMLHMIMLEKKIYNVFIKPRYGAGAAGVCAYRMHPKTRQGILYTAISYQEGIVYNTKKLRCYHKPEEIEIMINTLLQEEVIIERWMAKATFKKDSYDLRVVWQFGKPAFVVARRSKGPITNLHLNNNVLSFEELQLSKKVKDKIYKVCRDAVACFNGLQVVGIDVLLSPTYEPYIIEMNGQGDLLYQDIYHNNAIYKEQIRQLDNMRKNMIIEGEEYGK